MKNTLIIIVLLFSMSVSAQADIPYWMAAPCDTTLEIRCIPNSGYHFVRWSDGNTENPRVVTVLENLSLVAEVAEDIETQLESIYQTVPVKVTKYFENKCIIIERNGVRYTIHGQKLQ